MKLQVYADRLSQPSRAILIFCKVNKINFEEVKVNLAKGEHRKPEFKAVNPMGLVPAIAEGKFKLFESHAILRYLALAYNGAPDHWYPADLATRAKIDSILDWHHSNLRRGADRLLAAVGLVLNRVLAPALGRSLNPVAAMEAEKILISSLSNIETIWLQGSGKFLLGGLQPSIADLSLVCEIMQLEVLEANDRERILGPFTKTQQWIENVKQSTNPHFEDVHASLYKAAKGFDVKRKERLKAKL